MLVSVTLPIITLAHCASQRSVLHCMVTPAHEFTPVQDTEHGPSAQTIVLPGQVLTPSQDTSQPIPLGHRTIVSPQVPRPATPVHTRRQVWPAIIVQPLGQKLAVGRNIVHESG